MAMYDKLVKRLREYAEYFPCIMDREDAIKAADVIEELVRKEKFHTFLWNTIQPNEMEAYIYMYNAGSEKEES